MFNNFFRCFYIIGMKKSINLFYNGLEFLVNSFRKEAEMCADQRLKWLKDLYLNLYYDCGNKKFQPPTPMQALLAFGGRQFNFNLLENNFHSSFSSLVTTCSNLPPIAINPNPKTVPLSVVTVNTNENNVNLNNDTDSKYTFNNHYYFM